MESGGITIAPGSSSRSDTAEEWEGRLSDLHGTLSVLEEVRGKIVLAPPAAPGNSSSSGSSGSDREQQQRLESLEQELRECREDLQRDEEIFSEKVTELNRFR